MRRVILRTAAPGAAWLALAATAGACTVCDSGTGRAVRARIFNDEFVPHLVATAAPFGIFAAVAAGLHFGLDGRPGRRP